MAAAFSDLAARAGSGDYPVTLYFADQHLSINGPQQASPDTDTAPFLCSRLRPAGFKSRYRVIQ